MILNSRNTTNTAMKATIKKKRIPRTQKGYFHVILKSNFQVNIFEDSKEVEIFLQLFNKYAQKYSTALLGYVIMATHVHLIIYSEQISKFMQIWLHNFSKYRNLRYKTAGKIFISPFSSYNIVNNKILIESIFYLYYNPIAENICKHPKEYNWCSYSQHYFHNRKQYNSPKLICSSFITGIYKTEVEFDKAFFEYVKMKRENKKIVSNDGRMSDAPISSSVDDFGKLISPPTKIGNGYHPYSSKEFNTDTQIIEFRNSILAGRKLSSLQLKEIDNLIVSILKNTYANKRQIASAMMVSYEHVRKIERLLILQKNTTR